MFRRPISFRFFALIVALLTGLGPFLVPGNAPALDWFKRVEVQPEENDRFTITQVQIYLDHQRLGPGKIDGVLGKFTLQAVDVFNQTRNEDPGNWYRLLKEARKEVPNPYLLYTVDAVASDYVGSLPAEPVEQAKLKYMPYRSVAEFVAERFHTDLNFLRRLNAGKNVDGLKVGDQIVVPNVAPFRIENISKHQKFEEDPRLSLRRAIVDTNLKRVYFYEGDLLAGTFPVTPGQDQFIPYGNWKVMIMVTTPEFRYDTKMLQEGQRGDEYHQLPPGPNSPVGIFWTGLNKSGIGLHGTSSPETIGRSRSAGCIRLANWDAVRMQDLVRPGAAVTVQ